jgi:hypothetical protein
MRYLLHNHPAFPGLLSKEDLYTLVERSSLARGDLCTDVQTGRDHTVGEVISGMRPPRASSPPRVDRPAYQEFRADDPHEIDETPPEDEEDPEEEIEEEEEEERPRYTESGERIWHFGHPSWFSYWKGLFLTLLCLFAAGMLFSMGRSSKEVRICDIRSLDVWEKGFKGIVLRLGTLDVSSAGTAGIEVRFSDIRQAHKVKELIRQLQRGADPEEE